MVKVSKNENTVKTNHLPYSVFDAFFLFLKITEVGYAQGMNDIMSRFLFVMDTEAEAYWMFVNYMEHFKKDFMEEGMLWKICK